MRSRLIEKLYAPVTQSSTTPTVTEWLDLSGKDGGCDCLAYQVSPVGTFTTGTATLQASLDKTAVITIGSAVPLTTVVATGISQDRPPFRFYRLSYTLATGSFVATTRVLAKGDGV